MHQFAVAKMNELIFELLPHTPYSPTLMAILRNCEGFHYKQGIEAIEHCEENCIEK